MTTRTSKTAKHTNYEGRFFGMIALAWVLLTFAFNVLHSHLPQAKTPAAKAPHAATTAAHVTHQVASLH